MQDLCSKHHDKRRLEREDQRCQANRGDPGSNQGALPSQRVGQCAPRNQKQHTGEAADRQRQPDVLFRPAEIRQIERQERAEADLHVGHEEIRPIETVTTLIRDLAIAQLALVAMLRDQTTRVRMKVAQTRFEPAPAADWGGVRTGGRAVCRRWHAHRSLFWLTLSARRLRPRSEEHTSELQSRRDLVCRLLLEKKKKNKIKQHVNKKKKKKKKQDKKEAKK